MRGNCVSSVLSVMVEVKEKNEATEAEERKLQSHWFLVPLWFKEKKKPNPGPKTLWGSSLTQLPWFHMQFSFLLFLSTTFLKPCRPCLLHLRLCGLSLLLTVCSVCLSLCSYNSQKGCLYPQCFALSSSVPSAFYDSVLQGWDSLLRPVYSWSFCSFFYSNLQRLTAFFSYTFFRLSALLCWWVFEKLYF